MPKPGSKTAVAKPTFLMDQLPESSSPRHYCQHSGRREAGAKISHLWKRKLRVNKSLKGIKWRGEPKSTFCKKYFANYSSWRQLQKIHRTDDKSFQEWQLSPIFSDLKGCNDRDKSKKHFQDSDRLWNGWRLSGEMMQANSEASTPFHARFLFHIACPLFRRRMWWHS